MSDRPLIPSAIAKQTEDWELWKINAWRELGYDEGYQAGLKRAAEICTYHDSHYRNRLEMLPTGNEKALVERSILIACLALVKKIEQSILWEISEDAPPSMSP